jgi:hypothetical protein
MSQKNLEGEEKIIADTKLICPHCKNDRFTERGAQLNTSTAPFFGFDWANKSAYCFVVLIVLI